MEKDTPQERYRKKNPEKYRQYSLKQYYKDPAKAAIKAKLWREKNKEYIKEKQKQDKRKRKLLAIEYLGGKCNSCGNVFHPAIYEFHHKNPEEKDRDPSKMLCLSWKRLSSELEKCLLLCANCHRLQHHSW
jgi:hypothetical protein